MAIVLFVVKATITADREAAYNQWYHNEHIPQLLSYRGAASARRYRKLLGEDKYQYMTQYEFADEATFDAFQNSDHFADLIAEYNANFGDASERIREAYVQVWP